MQNSIAISIEGPLEELPEPSQSTKEVSFSLGKIRIREDAASIPWGEIVAVVSLSVPAQVAAMILYDKIKQRAKKHTETVRIDKVEVQFNGESITKVIQEKIRKTDKEA